MSYGRLSEPRRSPDGRTGYYGGRRGYRGGGHRSPDFRDQQDLNYRRRGCYNRSPEYSDRYRRRSPPGPRGGYGRGPRGYRGGGWRNVPYYRRSRSGSRVYRRSRSVDSYSRHEKYPQKENVPSARIGSKASYMRSRDTRNARGASRTPSHSRDERRRSLSFREQGEKREGGNRSESRGRHRDRREDFQERSRRHLSPDRHVPRNRTPDHHESSYYKERSTRQPSIPDKRVASGRSADRHGSVHSEGRQQSPNGSGERKAISPTRHLPAHERNSKWSRSSSRARSNSRKRGGTITSRRFREFDGHARRRSHSGSGHRKVATSGRHLPEIERNLRRRSLSWTRRRADGTPTQRSPERDRSPIRRARTGSRERVDGSPSRRSPDHHRNTRRRSCSESRGKVDATPSRQSPYRARLSLGSSRERPRDRASSHRGPSECPTPDLASARARNGDSNHTNLSRRSLGREEKRILARDASRAHSDEASEKQTSGKHESSLASEDARLKHGRIASLSRSPLVRSRVADGGDDETKEHPYSEPTAHPREKSAAPRQGSRNTREVTQPFSGTEAPGENGSIHGDASSKPEEEMSPRRGGRAASADSRRSRSLSLRSHDSKRRLNECLQDNARRSSGHISKNEPQAWGGTAADKAADSGRNDEPLKAHGKSTAEEDVSRVTDVGKAIVKRRIVTTEPRTAPVGRGEFYREPQESSLPRRYRVQRVTPERGSRVLSDIGRFQPVNYNYWNRFEREERLGVSPLLPSPYPGYTGRSVRLVQRKSFLPPQHHIVNMAYIEGQQRQLHNGAFQRAGQPRLFGPLRGRHPTRIMGGGKRKMAGSVGGGPPERRQATAASNADGKWSHDLFEQLSNEPERKRKRFNLYGETLETVDD